MVHCVRSLSANISARSMSFYTAHPDSPPPLPPIVKGIVLVLSVFMTLVLIAFIGFITFDFVADIAGFPLRFADPNPTHWGVVSTEQDIGRELKGPFELITPNDQTQMPGPEIVVIYTVRTSLGTAPDLLIKGVPHPWEMQFGDNTWFARLQLSPGKYHIQAGEAQADFFVVAPDTASDTLDPWMWHRPHLETNDVTRCDQCHAMSEALVATSMPDRDRAIGSWKGIASCFACHDEKDHAVVHRFILPRTEQNLRCARCHTIH